MHKVIWMPMENPIGNEPREEGGRVLWPSALSSPQSRWRPWFFFSIPASGGV